MGDILVEDKYHAYHVRDELVTMWKKEELLDYSIRGHYRTFRIHSVVLAASSPTFREMLSSDAVEAAGETTVTFPNIPDGVIDAIIDFAYTGTCKMNNSKILRELHEAATYLKIYDLKQCLTMHLDNVRNENKVTTIEHGPHAFLLLGELRTMQKANQLRDYNITFKDSIFPIHSVLFAAISPMFKDMLRLDMRQNPTFPTISKELMVKIINFTYHGNCTIQNVHLPEMIEAANVLKMSNLKQICQHHATLLTATITVTDQSRPSRLCEEMVVMWKDEELCDYSIQGHNRTFRIHSVVLAAVSPTFKRILRSGRREVINTELTFPNISDNHIAKLIEFSYTGECTIKREQLVELTEAAQYLEMNTLVQVCQQNASHMNGGVLLKDTHNPSHLFEELVTMWREKELLDYDIIGKEDHRTFRIFSILFCAMSPMFKGMLSSGMQEASRKETSFQDIPDEILSAVIEFVHEGTCTILRDQLMELIKAAHFLDMNALLQLSEQQVEAVLSPANCLVWSRFAIKYDLTMTTAKIAHFKRTYFPSIILTDSFAKLTKSECIQFLQDVHEYGLDVDNLCGGMFMWLTYHWRNRLEYTRDVLLCLPIRLKFLEDYFKAQTHSKSTPYILAVLKTMQKKEDETILVCGGYSSTGEVNTKCWKLQGEEFELIAEQCNQEHEQKIITSARFHSLCTVPGGIMMTGGDKSDICLMFSMAEKKWTKCPEMLVARSHHGSGYNKGKVFVIGGYVDGSLSLSVDFLDMVYNVWQNGLDVPGLCSVPRVVSFFGNIYVLFTETCDWYRLHENDKELSFMERMYPAKQKDRGGKMVWSKLSSLPMKSSGCSLTATERTIFAVGGSEQIAFMYYPIQELWLKLTGPSITEIEGSLIYHAEKFYLFPGFTFMDPELVDVEEFDIENESWSLSKWKMPKPLRLFGAFAIDKRKEEEEEDEDNKEEDDKEEDDKEEDNKEEDEYEYYY